MHFEMIRQLTTLAKSKQWSVTYIRRLRHNGVKVKNKFFSQARCRELDKKDDSQHSKGQTPLHASSEKRRHPSLLMGGQKCVCTKNNFTQSNINRRGSRILTGVTGAIIFLYKHTNCTQHQHNLSFRPPRLLCQNIVIGLHRSATAFPCLQFPRNVPRFQSFLFHLAVLCATECHFTSEDKLINVFGSIFSDKFGKFSKQSTVWGI